MEISAQNLTAKIGETLPVLIDASPEPHLFEGRSMLQAPEVDGLTYVRTPPEIPPLTIGQIVPVTISAALDYDLIGKPS